MAISLDSLQKGSVSKPPRIVLHGVAKIGKSTLASNAPAPVFIQTEDGADELGVDRFPLSTSFEDVMQAMTVLANEEHNFKTAVIDSLDWLEPLVQQKACRDHGWSSIEDPGYGKGYMAALDVWGEYISAINYLRDTKQMTIFQIAHNHIRRFDDPSNDPYDRYEIKLHKGASAKIMEHADAILFANYRTSVKETDVGFNNKKSRAIGTGERMLFSEERPAFIAGNRYSMPAEMPLAWDSIQNTIPYFNQTSGE